MENKSIDTMEEGLTLNEVLERMPKKTTQEQIREAIEKMDDEFCIGYDEEIEDY